jgi:dTDP-4-amino-4,6-dideoxygalactose transaminase
MPDLIPYFRHDLGQPELAKIAEVLSGDILTTGAYVEEFERRFAAYLGVRHALGVSHCTGALHLALLAFDIGAGDEVITTPMSFVATATAIIEAGAKPVFVDVEPRTGNLDAERVAAAITSRTKAIVPVHLYGAMCDMRALRRIADAHRLRLIEDSAHCIEGKRDGIRPGQLGDAAAFSFYATKNLTCGEGGALVVNDSAIYEKLRLLRLHGMSRMVADRMRDGVPHWDMLMMGWKYNMSNIEAALLLPQFDRLEAKLAQRHVLAKRYASRLSHVRGLRLPATPPGTEVHAHHIYPIWIDAMPRDALLQALKADGIGTVVNYRAMHLLTWFREAMGMRPGDYPIAEEIGEKALSLPFYPGLSLQEVDIVCERIAHALERAGESVDAPTGAFCYK